MRVSYPMFQHEAVWKKWLSKHHFLSVVDMLYIGNVQRNTIKCYRITTGWNTALSAKQEGVWGTMSVFRHYSMSKPQRQRAAKDSSIITTFFFFFFLWLSPQKELHEKLQVQEEAFSARIEKLKKAWGLGTSEGMPNFRETNKPGWNNKTLWSAVAPPRSGERKALFPVSRPISHALSCLPCPTPTSEFYVPRATTALVCKSLERSVWKYKDR